MRLALIAVVLIDSPVPTTALNSSLKKILVISIKPSLTPSHDMMLRKVHSTLIRVAGTREMSVT